jgi:1-acyl-sn-glycerol-3-phosphate acyltransferase
MRLVHAVVVSFFRGLVSLVFRIHDAELAKVPPRGPLIIVCNHVHIWELPVLYTHLMPRPVIGLVLASRWENPLTRFILDAVEAIPLRRGEADLAGLRKAMAALESGKIIIIAPEGTRSGSGILGQGHAGVAWLAIQSGAPLLPVVHHGSENYRQNMHRLRRTDLYLEVGTTFRVRNDEPFSHEIRQQVADEIMCQLAGLLPEQYRGKYNLSAGLTPAHLIFSPTTD